jgi:glycosyltransferase involved in cell wall biosynthesis
VISVIVCTFNRDRMLEETVRSFLDCRTDGLDYELLLLDNNSTDKTREIGVGFAAQFTKIRYINEPVQGHPHTKNRGVRESRGEIVAFVDDDVYFSPGWLEAIASAFERHPDVACIGGKVVPHFEGDRPSWLEDDLLDVYSVAHYGDNEREIQPPEYPIGCNMAFRRSVFKQLGGFPTSLGRKPGNLLSNDETYFLLCVVNSGLKLLYSPDAQVSHRISADRTTQQWLLRRWYWQGISHIAMRQIGEDPLPRKILAKQAIKAFYGLLRQWKNTARSLSAKSRSDEKVPIRKQIEIWCQLGKLRQTIIESLTLTKRNEIGKGGKSYYSINGS